MSTEESLSIWDYRVVRDEFGTYRIQEVYYYRDGSIAGWCSPSLQGDSETELRAEFDSIYTAFDLPVLLETKEGNEVIIADSAVGGSEK